MYINGLEVSEQEQIEYELWLEENSENGVVNYD